MTSRRSSRRLFVETVLLAAPVVWLRRSRVLAQASAHGQPAARRRIPQTFGENLRHKQLSDRTFKDLLWPGASFQKLKASRVRFNGALFHNCDWQAAELTDVSFERCTLHNCDLSAAVLRGCSFVDCQIEGFGGKRSALLDTRFVRTQCEGLVFTRSKLQGVTFEAGSLRQSAVSSSEIGVLALSKTPVEHFELLDNQAGALALSFDACDVSQFTLRGGFKRLHARAGNLTNWNVHEGRAEALTIEDAASIFDLRVSDVNAQRVTIARPKGSVDFYIQSLSTPQLELSGGSFAGHFEQSTFGKDSRVSQTKLVSVFWDGSRLDGVVFDDVTFEEAIVARNTHFAGVKLKDVHYAKKLAFMLEGAVFERSDRFPEK